MVGSSGDRWFGEPEIWWIGNSSVGGLVSAVDSMAPWSWIRGKRCHEPALCLPGIPSSGNWHKTHTTPVTETAHNITFCRTWSSKQNTQFALLWLYLHLVCVHFVKISFC